VWTRESTARPGRVVSTPSYSGDPGFKSQPRDRLTWDFCWFPQSLQENCCIPSWDRLAGRADPLGGSLGWSKYCSWKLLDDLLQINVTSVEPWSREWWSALARAVPTSNKSQVRSGVETDKARDQRVNTGGRASWFYTSLVTPTFKKFPNKVTKYSPSRYSATVYRNLGLFTMCHLTGWPRGMIW
jgi:hypothetical protein